MQNKHSNILIECEKIEFLDNVVDLYESAKERQIINSYAQKVFNKKSFSSEVKKWNRKVDNGDFKVSEDFLLFTQFVDYKIRFVNFKKLTHKKSPLPKTHKQMRK